MTRVTVLVAVHNGGTDLAASVQSILEQTFADFELLVVDDGSVDETAGYLASIEDPRLRVMTVSHRGPAAALQAGLLEANGEYVARQDHDDVSHPTRLERQVAYLDANPSVALVGAWAVIHDGNGHYLDVLTPPVSDAAIRWLMLFRSGFVNSSTMFRRSAALAAGGYIVRGAEDFDLWSRIAVDHGLTNQGLPLVAYKLHPAGLHASNHSIQRSLTIRTANVKAELAGTHDAEHASMIARLFTSGTEFPSRDLPAAVAALVRLQDHFLRTHSNPEVGASITAADRKYVSSFTFRVIAAAGLLAARPTRLILLLRVLRLSRRAGAGAQQVAVLGVLLVAAALVGGGRSVMVHRVAEHLRRDDPQWLLFHSSRRVVLPLAPAPGANVFDRLIAGLTGARWTYVDG